MPARKKTTNGHPRAPQRAGPGRPRSEDSRRAILEAALSLLAQRGYADTTMSAIAEHAGASKQTLYRWWRSKAEVVFEALKEFAASEIGRPAGGDARDDLQAFLDRTFAALRGPVGDIMRSLMADAQLDPAFRRRFREEFIMARRAALGELVQRTLRQHGAEPSREEIDVALDQLYGAMWYRLLIGNAPLNSAFARRLVDSVLAPHYRG